MLVRKRAGPGNEQMAWVCGDGHALASQVADGILVAVLQRQKKLFSTMASSFAMSRVRRYSVALCPPRPRPSLLTKSGEQTSLPWGFSPILAKTPIVLTLDEAILGDTLLDPGGEIPADFQKSVQITGVDGLRQVGADGLLLNTDEVVHVESPVVVPLLSDTCASREGSRAHFIKI